METNNHTTLVNFRFVFYVDDEVFFVVLSDDIINAIEKFKVMFGHSLLRSVTTIVKID